MKHEEKAVAYFGNNFNCSQSVFATFAEELGMDVEKIAWDRYEPDPVQQID